MAGELYDCHDRVFIERKARASEWCRRYNAVPYSERGKRHAMLRELFGSVGEHVTVGDEFLCGFGDNIYIGEHVSVTIRCVFVDCNRITIGDRVLIAPGVQINTSTHPVELTERLNLEARERYEMMQRLFPEVCRRANLGHIASFLGITQQSLSRIRGKRD